MALTQSMGVQQSEAKLLNDVGQMDGENEPHSGFSTRRASIRLALLVIDLCARVKKCEESKQHRRDRELTSRISSLSFPLYH